MAQTQLDQHAEYQPIVSFGEESEHKVATTSASLTTFVVLALMSALALAVGFSDLQQPWKVVASLAVACTQATILAAFFMDLRQADRLTLLVAGASLFWTAILFLFTITDYITRHMGVL